MRQVGHSWATFGLLVAVFAVLWIPVGQHGFLYPHWMKVGTFLAPFLLFTAAAFRADHAPSWSKDLTVLSLLMLVAYIVHQFEEHWIDLYGNEYAFHGSVNQLLQEVTGTESEPLTPAGIFVINTSLVWLVGALAIWRGENHVFPALAMAAIIVVNAVAHIALGVAGLEYNPGLLTSIVVFLPIGGYVYRRVLRDGLAPPGQVAASILWGVLAHVIMVGGLVVGNVMGLFPELVYFAALIVWSVVPVFLFRTSSTARSGSPVASSP
ncbi:MAG: HXXEE domain-containing protein [Myxococcota bacterium]